MYPSWNRVVSRLVPFIFILHSSYSSLCSHYYPSQPKQSSCECEDLTTNGQASVAIKCLGSTTIPRLIPDLHYQKIDFESCLEDLNFGEKLFTNIIINVLRIRHCNFFDLTERTFANINELEKFHLENSTIKSSFSPTGNFQDLFASNSFQNLRSLTLKQVHYHQTMRHDQKINLELLLQQLPKLYRLELMNIHLDNYRHQHIQSIGQHLTHLSLANTHQTSLLPLEYLASLERLLIRHLPELFRTSVLISSLAKLPKLKYVLFEHNQLTTIEHLRSASIDDIDLSSNLIERIDGYTFEHVPKLRQLILTGNPLNSIDQHAFCGIEHLQRLSIHIKHRSISPLNECLLLDYPQLQIIQDSQTKFQCNCQLVHVARLKRQQSKEINRLLKLNDVCLATNQQVVNLYELEKTLNCSATEHCRPACQERKVKSSQTKLSPSTSLNGKNNAAGHLLYSCLSQLVLLLFLAFLPL